MYIYHIHWIFKFIFNLAIIILISRFFYAPFDDKLMGTNLVYILPCIGLISSYLYLSAWFGWKKSFYILLYFVGYLILMGYFLLNHLLPKWVDNIIITLTLSIVGYFCYRIINRIIKTMIYRYKGIKSRINTYSIRSKRNK
jgi:hypothetical protein